MPQKMDVSVFNVDYVEITTIKLINRPARLLPTGSAGVIYDGKVYPVYAKME